MSVNMPYMDGMDTNLPFFSQEIGGKKQGLWAASQTMAGNELHCWDSTLESLEFMTPMLGVEGAWKEETYIYLGGGFHAHLFYFHPEHRGNHPTWRAYFFRWVVQPPNSYILVHKSFFWRYWREKRRNRHMDRFCICHPDFLNHYFQVLTSPAQQERMCQFLDIFMLQKQKNMSNLSRRPSGIVEGMDSWIQRWTHESNDGLMNPTMDSWIQRWTHETNDGLMKPM